uniref:hypothetical protein n=1 Tax=Prevotella sp. TaxID=59823 RepID=UPI004029BA41
FNPWLNIAQAGLLIIRSGGLRPPPQSITLIIYYNDFMCYEHLRFLLYKLGAVEAGDLRYG